MQSFNKFSLQLLFRWNHLKSDLDVENDFDDKVGFEDRSSSSSSKTLFKHGKSSVN